MTTETPDLRRRHVPMFFGERQTLTEKRAGDNADTRTGIQGYGAVFYDGADPGTEYRIWSDLVERIMPGAFDDALASADVRCLFNHDANFPLGRRANTPSDTMQIGVDAFGLFYRIDSLPESRVDVAEAIARRDVTGSSFMFVPIDELWRTITDENDREIDVVEVHAVRLLEQGPVVFPAYESTTSQLRATDSDGLAVRTARAEWRKRSGRPVADAEQLALATQRSRIRLRARARELHLRTR